MRPTNGNHISVVYWIASLEPLRYLREYIRRARTVGLLDAHSTILSICEGQFHPPTNFTCYWFRFYRFIATLFVSRKQDWLIHVGPDLSYGLTCLAE